MVNAKTFRTMKKSLYLRIMVDLKGIEPSTSRMRTERSPDGDGKQTLEPEFTFFVHITGCKMNSKAIKIDFRAEYPPI